MYGGTPHSARLECEMPAPTATNNPDQLTESVLRRYLENVLLGKQLTTGPTLLSRLLFLLTGVEVYLYYLGLLQKSTPETQVSWKQLEWCFDLIETDAQVQRENLLPHFLGWENQLLERWSTL